MPDFSGLSVGRYHIIEPLGEGGMATVYRALDTRLDCDVAVKFIRMDQLPPAEVERTLKRFKQEAIEIARLTHPNIVKVTDYGEYDGTPYLVMEYLPGGTLKTLAGTPLPFDRAARLLAPVARAMEAAHHKNLIHRDIKPANILLTDEGQPMISDFGVAKILGSEGDSTMTRANTALGTAEYMAPEQWLNQISAQSDIYSLGVVFYELVTGQKPYTADTPVGIFLKQSTEALPRPRSFVASLPEEVEQVLYKALARKPEERYASMAEFAEALEELASLAKTVRVSQPKAPEAVSTHPETPAAVPKPMQPQINQIERLSPIPAKVVQAPQPKAPVAVTTHSETPALAPKPPQPQDNQMKGLSIPAKVVQTPQPKAPVAGTAHSEAPAAAPKPLRPQAGTWGKNLGAVRRAGERLYVILDEGVEMELIHIPGGDFLMGSSNKDKYALSEERPQHKVYLDEYWIGHYPVTNRQYQIFVQSAKHAAPSGWTGTIIPAGNENQSVINVTWKDAVAFCNWLGRLGRQGGENLLVRLPSEAEWEKAARGTKGRIYPWGERIPDKTLCNFKNNIGKSTTLGNYSPQGDSPYGCADMAGNVWEWVNDWYSDIYYQQSPSRNPSGPISGTSRVLRGGSWQSDIRIVRSAYRVKGSPDSGGYNIGFRCAASP